MRDVAGSTSGEVEGLDPWAAVCLLADLTPDRGVCALVDGDAVAVFRMSFDGSVHAIGNHDPFCDASVLSRGLVGWADVGGEPVPYVASPMRKHRFDLRTGEALDGSGATTRSYPVRIRDGRVEVAPVAGATSGSLTPVTVP